MIKNVVMTAASALSGGNKQPWTFVIVKEQPVKRQIRIAAEDAQVPMLEKKLFEEVAAVF